MTRWTIEEPIDLELDGVVTLRATIVAGSLSVLATDAPDAVPSVVVHHVSGPPLRVVHEAGLLTITQDNLLDGVLGWLRTRSVRADVTVTVPRECPVSVNLVSADGLISGLGARASVKSASGTVTLDGVTGDVDANTVSGAIEATGLDGTVSFTSVSGDLALAGGTVARLGARTVSGRVTADVELPHAGRIDVHSVSGDVALRVPATAGAAVALSSAAGAIDTSFAELRRQEVGIMKNIGGTIGDGAGKVAVTTVSGAVTLLARDDDSPEITDSGTENPR
ncbi:DUF4097 family beta strand repeat-containing protein [Actinomadura atramentaria]|uniref:DUF4097 family beta strand repeat-containing protein n=1 Tax=Actinomadura atramentaria TaxID=1990 RepID=UPI0003634517|nr:DUF4097 family beta strand repeat-containing protein [Actinomadura atramentaria]